MAKKQKVALEPACEWERQPTEGVQQYERFCAYRDMKYQVEDPGKILTAGEKLALGQRMGRRSLRKLADQLGCSRQVLEELSSRFHWRSRAEAYDLDIEERVRRENETELFKMRKVHAELARRMVTKAGRGLLLLPDDALDANAVARLVEVGTKVERLSRGESTENQQVSGRIQEEHSHTLDLSDLTTGELREILAKLGGGPDGEAGGP